jgi:hypothetical protein
MTAGNGRSRPANSDLPRDERRRNGTAPPEPHIGKRPPKQHYGGIAHRDEHSIFIGMLNERGEVTDFIRLSDDQAHSLGLAVFELLPARGGRS